MVSAADISERFGSVGPGESIGSRLLTGSKSSASILHRCDLTLQVDVLNSGSHERLKAGIHGTALGLAVVMGVYNAAAWLQRRAPHLAVNAVLYTALAAWEQRQVAHHLATIRTTRDLEPAGRMKAKSGKVAA
jgi:hypothetical protein